MRVLLDTKQTVVAKKQTFDIPVDGAYLHEGVKYYNCTERDGPDDIIPEHYYYDGSNFIPFDQSVIHAKGVAGEKLSIRVLEEFAKDFTVGGITTSVDEMRENKDLLDGTEDVTLKLKSGSVTIPMDKQAGAKTFIKNRFRKIANREGVIAGLVEAETTPGGVIDTLNSEIDDGWPT